MFNHSYGSAQIKQTSWLMHNLSTFGVRTSHRQPWTHKTHHDPNLGEATTFPLIVFSTSLHGGHIHMAFCHGIPKWESRNSHGPNSRNFGAHNFACRPLIAMRSETKLYPWSRAFQRYVVHCLHVRKLCQF
jgi:hypothetical protein